MLEPGLDRHDWESQWAILEEELHEAPREALPELERLLHQMLTERGFEPDHAPRDGEAELLVEFRAGSELRRAAEGDAGSGGDVAAAIESFRAVYESLLTERRTP